MRTLTVIAPVYNEEEVIADFYRELKTVLDTLSGYHSTMLFVVGRGEDSTFSILKELAATDKAIKVLYLSARFGHQMQLLAGIDHSDSDAVIMMDSDLQHPPSVIPRILSEFEKGNEVVYTIREKTSDQGLLRKWCSELFYWFLDWIQADRYIVYRESAASGKKQILVISSYHIRSFRCCFFQQKAASGRDNYRSFVRASRIHIRCLHSYPIFLS